jgi:hypothetical protein
MATFDLPEILIRNELFKSILDSFGKVLPAEFLKRRRLILGEQTQVHPILKDLQTSVVLLRVIHHINESQSA